MGKATQAVQQLHAQVLSQEELEERRALEESGGEVQATQDGRLVKPKTAEREERVTQLPTGTWD